MRLLLAAVVFLAAAVPALAASQNVQVSDDQLFHPGSTQVDPGDTVTWHWDGADEHTVTSRPKQIDRFDSGIEHGPGAQFPHTFKYRGRFRYLCEIHPDTMRATVTVGTDDGIAPKISKVRARVSGSTVKLTFRLSERSVVTVKVGHRKKTVKAGRHSVKFKGLSDGLHKARLSAKDGFGHRGTKSKRFTIG